MNRVGAYLLVAATGSACVTAGVELGLRRVQNSYTKKLALVGRTKDSTEVAFLGPSGSLFGLNPSLVRENSINLANVSQSLHYDAAIARRYLPRVRHLKLVVFGVGLFSMEARLRPTTEYWREFWYSHFSDLPPESTLEWNDLRRWSAIALYPPRQRMSALAAHFQYDAAPTIDAKTGFSHDYEVSRRLVSDEDARAEARREVAELKQTTFRDNSADLEDGVRAVHELHAAAVIVLFPAVRAYFDQFDPAVRERARAAFSEIGLRLGAKFVDYSLDSRFTRADFYDANHLNGAGAAKWSRIVDDEVITPALAATRDAPP